MCLLRGHVKKIKIKMNEVHHYPLFYYCRRGESDINMILTLLQNVPVNEQQSVSDSYESLYLRSGRVEANNWLKERCNG